MTEVAGLADLSTRLEKEGGSGTWFEDVCVDVLGKGDAIQWLHDIGYFHVSDEVWEVVAIGFAMALCERVLPGRWTKLNGPRSALPEGSPVPMGGEWRFVIELDRAPYIAVGDGPTRAVAVVTALLRALEDGK